MKLFVYQIGSIGNDRLIGVAYDTDTLRALIELAEFRGATGVSLHGTVQHLRESISGEFTLSEAKREYFKAVDAATAEIMDGIDPAFGMQP
jgi:hypothetical protein